MGTKHKHYDVIVAWANGEEEIEDIYYSGLTFENTYLAAFFEGSSRDRRG